MIVNRLWQHHFGRGIVATPSDFGAQGERPTHPELLDWLAAELIRGGWRLKPIHKLIDDQRRLSPDGRRRPVRGAARPRQHPLLAASAPRRLEAEAIRDAMLAVSGTLDPTMFGPGTLDEAMRRRSIYFTVKRSQLIPMMILFDAPDGLAGSASRPSTTVAPQSLLLMNNPHVRGCAAGLRRPRRCRIGGVARRGGPSALSPGPRPRARRRTSWSRRSPSSTRRPSAIAPTARRDALRDGAGRLLPGADGPERVRLRRMTP